MWWPGSLSSKNNFFVMDPVLFSLFAAGRSNHTYISEDTTILTCEMAELEQLKAELAEAEHRLEVMKQQRKVKCLSSLSSCAPYETPRTRGQSSSASVSFSQPPASQVDISSPPIQDLHRTHHFAEVTPSKCDTYGPLQHTSLEPVAFSGQSKRVGLPLQVGLARKVHHAGQQILELQRTQSHIRHLASIIQQRGVRIYQLQQELLAHCRSIVPTVPPQYPWSAVPVSHPPQLPVLLGLEEAITHILASSNPAMEDIIEHRDAQLAASGKPVCSHCHRDYATFWRAFLNDSGKQVVVCETCDWRRVKKPFSRQYEKKLAKELPRGDCLYKAMMQLLSLQHRDDQLLREEYVKLRSSS